MSAGELRGAPREFVQRPALPAPAALLRVVVGARQSVARGAVEQIAMAPEKMPPGGGRGEACKQQGRRIRGMRANSSDALADALGFVARTAVAALVALEVGAACDWVRLREPRTRRRAVAVPAKTRAQALKEQTTCKYKHRKCPG